MMYDSARERVVLVSGFSDSNAPDTWEWDGSTWTLAATTGPGPRVGSATYDAGRGVCVISGGFNGINGDLFTDTWTYDGTWTQAATTGFAPRQFAGPLAYDRVAGASILFGGVSLGGGPIDETWLWDGQWHQLAPTLSPPGRGGNVAFGAPDGAGIYVAVGTTDLDDGGVQYTDAWRLQYTSDESHETCAIAVDNDNDGKVGCDDPDCAPSCAYCGDGICSTQENCRMCADDCSCTAVCGDNFCDTGETADSCPGDCTP
jgi:hypothetical protein